MRKFFRVNGEVHELDADGSQDYLITENHIPMTIDEVNRHLYPEMYMTEAEKYNLYLSKLKSLTRRQFKLGLLEAGLLDQIDNSISAIDDAQTRAQIQIEYTEATEFHRTGESVAYMCQLLGLTNEQVDQMWEHALTL